MYKGRGQVKVDTFGGNMDTTNHCVAATSSAAESKHSLCGYQFLAALKELCKTGVSEQVMAMSSPPSLNSSGSSTFSLKYERESPKNRSSSFSISDILSDDIGSQRRSIFSATSTPTSSGEYSLKGITKTPSVTPKRPKDSELPRSGSVRRPPQITLTEAGGLLAPNCSTTIQVHPSHPVASIGGSTPPMHPSCHHNSSLSASPFDPSFLHALGQQASPTDKEDLLSDSLGMLSTVALYHSGMSSTLGTPIHNKMADIRITSTCDGSDKSTDWNGADPVLTTSQRTLKSRTPSILKRRARQPSGSESGASGDEYVACSRPNLNMGFLSPLADEKSNQQSGFSPSIFLSRPNNSTDTPVRTESTRNAPNSFSDTDSNHDDDFTTSTPIKSDKENVVQRGGDKRARQPAWSPNILRAGAGRQLLKEANESSSGSESEHPIKRPLSSPLSPPQKRRKKSKARTKLSPLLENACSPIPKADHTPSPLTQAHSTTPTRPPQSQAPHSSTSLGPNEIPRTASHPRLPLSNPTTHTLQPSQPSANPFLNPLSQALPTCVIPQLYPAPTASLTFPLNPILPTTAPVMPPGHFQQPGYPTPVLSPTHQYPRPLLSPPMGLPQPIQVNPYLSRPIYIPQSGGFGNNLMQLQVMPNFAGNTQNFVHPGNAAIVPANLLGNSLNSSHNASNSSFVRRDEKLKSVPPRFIFSNMKPEGKRSRLTEAINKSLSETPSVESHNTLPKEWTKYACGQTNDQRDLTEKARSFILQCRPRTLNFEEEAS